MAGFKVGERVITLQSARDVRLGGEYEVLDISSINLRFRDDAGDIRNWRPELFKKKVSMDILQPQTVITDGDEDFLVLAVVEDKVLNVKIPRNLDGHERSGDLEWDTVDFLKKHGYHVKGEEPEIVELTIEEVAKLKGVPVDQIRIKD